MADRQVSALRARLHVLFAAQHRDFSCLRLIDPNEAPLQLVCPDSFSVFYVDFLHINSVLDILVDSTTYILSLPLKQNAGFISPTSILMSHSPYMLFYLALCISITLRANWNLPIRPPALLPVGLMTRFQRR
jgi:hypothetical protein